MHSKLFVESDDDDFLFTTNNKIANQNDSESEDLSIKRKLQTLKS